METTIVHWGIGIMEDQMETTYAGTSQCFEHEGLGSRVWGLRFVRFGWGFAEV